MLALTYLRRVSASPTVTSTVVEGGALISMLGALTVGRSLQKTPLAYLLAW